MPSIIYHAVKFGLKVMGFKKDLSINPVPYKRLRRWNVLEAPSKLRRKYVVQQTQIAETQITEISKKNTKTDTVILFLHGGAFIWGPTKEHWSLLDSFLKSTDTCTWMVNYPKAPEADIHQIQTNVAEVYARAVQQFSADKIILLGDSAGANLAMILVQNLIAEKKAIPRHLILITPAVDLSVTHPDVDALDKKDAMLSKVGVRSANTMYANGLDLKHPKVSPLFGSFEGFPSMTLLLAGCDILYADGQLAAAKIKAAKVDVEVIDEPDMFHDWPLLPFLAEARSARKRMLEVVNEIAG